MRRSLSDIYISAASINYLNFILVQMSQLKAEYEEKLSSCQSESEDRLQVLEADHKATLSDKVKEYEDLLLQLKVWEIIPVHIM